MKALGSSYDLTTKNLTDLGACYEKTACIDVGARGSVLGLVDDW
jgi:hypothetical protein